MTGTAKWAERRSAAGVAYNKLRNLANMRAAQRLAKAHPDEYRRYIAEERRRLGLDNNEQAR